MKNVNYYHTALFITLDIYSTVVYIAKCKLLSHSTISYVGYIYSIVVYIGKM